MMPAPQFPIPPPLARGPVQSGWVERSIQVAAGVLLPVRIYGQRTGSIPTSLVLHFHGGAFVGGSLENGSTMARLLADAGAIVVSLDYPLAPGHPFPEAADAGLAALAWLGRHRRRLGGEGAPVLVAGEEAGGNLAAAITLMARDQHSPVLAGQVLVSPMLDPCLGTASLRDADLSDEKCPWATGWRAYLARASDVGHPYAAPGICLRLGQVPATLLITAEDDPLRDEALAYATKLAKAGVDVVQAVLPSPTGWPQSFMRSESYDAGWAATVREHLRRFIAARQTATVPPCPAAAAWSGRSSPPASGASE